MYNDAERIEMEEIYVQRMHNKRQWTTTAWNDAEEIEMTPQKVIVISQSLFNIRELYCDYDYAVTLNKIF